MCFALFAVPVLSFSDDKQATTPQATPGELAHEKVTFNHNQSLYNDKANKDIRGKESAVKKIKSNEQGNKKIQKEQDVKGDLNEKNEQDGKNEQYDKQLVVKF